MLVAKVVGKFEGKKFVVDAHITTPEGEVIATQTLSNCVVASPFKYATLLKDENGKYAGWTLTCIKSFESNKYVHMGAWASEDSFKIEVEA